MQTPNKTDADTLGEREKKPPHIPTPLIHTFLRNTRQPSKTLFFLLILGFLVEYATNVGSVESLNAISKNIWRKKKGTPKKNQIPQNPPNTFGRLSFSPSTHKNLFWRGGGNIQFKHKILITLYLTEPRTPLPPLPKKIQNSNPTHFISFFPLRYCTFKIVKRKHFTKKTPLGRVVENTYISTYCR